MEIVYYGNIIEGFFWVGISLIFFLSACKRREPQRLFCIYGGVVFLLSACSDFYEAQTGAWWEPWWLILWNAGCGAGVGGMILWYIKINGSWAATMAKMKQPVFRRNTSESPEKNCIKKIPYDFRGTFAILFIVFLQIGVLYLLCYEFLGGGRGPVIDNKYYLDNYGDLTEVTYEVWVLIRYVGIASFSGFCLMIICGLSSYAAWKFRWEWYMKGKNYSALILVIIIFDFIFIIVGFVFHVLNQLGN